MNSLDVIIHKGHTVIITSEARNYIRRARSARADIILRQNTLFRELDYCEKKWYLECKKGALGAVRAFFWPTTSGVGDRLFKEPRWQRDPAGLSRRWTFTLPDENLDNMETFVRSEINEPLVGFSGWFKGKTSYHVFHNCHHFAARVLKSAGIEVSPWWAFSDKLMAFQLDNITDQSFQVEPTNQTLQPLPVKNEDF